MRLSNLLAATALAAFAGPALAGDINPVVNISTELANDLRGLTFTADGKILASGHVGTVNEETRTVVARFNADGSLDASFDGDGVVDLDFAPGRREQSLGVVSLANGDVIVAVNAADEDGGQSVYLLRFDSAGVQQVAPAWGDENGAVEVVFGWANENNDAYPGVEAPPTDTLWDLRLDTSDGSERLVAFGMGSAPDGSGRTDNDRYVVRLSAADGSVDPSFNGGAPHVFHSAGTFSDGARRGIVEADGSILASGYTNLGHGLANHVILVRLNPDGTPDGNFGNYIEPASSGTAVGLAAQPGVAVFNPFVANGGFAECYGVARLSDGSYVTTGYGGATGNGVASTLGYQSTLAPDMVTFRAGATGLDSAWGNKGTQAIQSEGAGQPTNEDRGRALVSLGDDRTVQFGRYGGNAAVFVLDANGQLDTTQDGDGIIELGHPSIGAQFFTAVLSPDGRRIATTTNSHEGGARLVVLEVGTVD